jgi:FkbM family methyltransferase
MTYTPPEHGPTHHPGLETRQWPTPGGNVATLTYRADTTDWNTVSACLSNPYGGGDEYHLPSGLSGWGLDVGAHIGSVTIGLLLDNPAMQVVAIEAVPDNVDLIRQNLAANGVEDRCVLLPGAAWKGRGPIEVEYGYTGSDVAVDHRFIGSITPWIDAPGEVQKATVPRYSLSDALKHTNGQGFVWVKTDCEGCEHFFFRGPGLKQLAVIEGEWHHRDGDPADLAERLGKTHEVTYAEGIGGGPFRAVRRPSQAALEATLATVLELGDDL